MEFKRIYLAIAEIYPKKMKAGLQKNLIYAGIPEDVDIWIGRAIITVLLFSVVAFMAPIMLIPYILLPTFVETIIKFSIPFFFIFNIIMAFIYYMYLFYRVQARTELVENVLPDFLLIVVSNLRAGMTPFSAFVAAAKPEFGPLEEEIKRVVARTSASKSLTHSLIELSERINSVSFQKTMLFFEKAVHSGGQTARILYASAEEIRRIKEMREEMLSQTRSYVVFLGFIIIFIAPFLIAVSGQFLAMFLKIKTEIMSSSSDMTFDMPVFQGEISIRPEFVEQIGTVFLILESLFISLFMGSLTKGKPFYGIKYFPLLAVGCLIMNYASKSMIGNLLKSFG